MIGSDNQKKASENVGKKRLPVFSLLLIACYLVVCVLFLVYGFGEGRVREESPDLSLADETATPPVETPDNNTVTVTDYPPNNITNPELPPEVQVKGVYVGAWFAVDKEVMDNFIDLCETTELNALVLDVKEDHGYITMPTNNELFPVNSNIVIENMGELVEDLKSRGIYTIARVVCFKDPRWAARNPHLSLRDRDGNRWTDRGGTAWLNPYMKENWEYIAEVCLEAARLGFEEIQLDYVRFPADGRLGDIHLGAAGEEQTRAEVIAEFITFIRNKMLEVGVRTSADVFGIIAISNNDAQIIGQDLDLLYPVLHSICPMIYPSHFANITQNGIGQIINGVLFETPDTEPYDVIYNTLQHFIRRLDPNNPNQAIIRPYLQDFTASYLGEGNFIPNGAEEVRAQIDAVYAAGLEEWILWNHVSRYSEDTFRNP
ncbi:MAG: putative glycoside hydrolase [Oscillospiraceae bacterium]|jgi:hypothetical protein|nr:putative glycoside hydrolase [Oscillospiraceae bacterium]